MHNKQDQKPITRISPIAVAIFGLFLGILIVIILALTGILNFNPYGKDIRIRNFSEYFSGIPRSTRNELFANLYKITEINNQNPKLRVRDAKIRADSVVIRDYPSDNISYGEFIVDIPSLEQSYRGSFSWSKDPEKNASMNDHNNLITCLADFDLIYDSFGCLNIVTDNPYYTLAGKYPILRLLPLNVSNYDEEGNYHEYVVTYRPNANNTDITLVINDKTGGNLDSAIEMLKKYNVNLEKTSISYVDYKAFKDLINQASELAEEFGSSDTTQFETPVDTTVSNTPSAEENTQETPNEDNLAEGE